MILQLLAVSCLIKKNGKLVCKTKCLITFFFFGSLLGWFMQWPPALCRSRKIYRKLLLVSSLIFPLVDLSCFNYISFAVFLVLFN
jgi:hypothetical protein